jgi:ABC-2 type transport system permease protein
MLRSLANIFWLGNKELRSVFSDPLMVVFIAWSFTFSITQRATGIADTVNNASIAVVDEDQSALSRSLRNALYPPYFKRPDLIEADTVDRAMDQSRYMFIIVVPPRFEANIRQGRQPKLQLNIDATAVMQAGIGAGYIQNILGTEITKYLNRADQSASTPVLLVQRRAFNPNGTQKWFVAIVALLDQLTMLTIVLTGAALLREREHGTIEHLLVMPLNAFEIAMAKVWANGLVILVTFTLSMLFIVKGMLNIPIAGSAILLITGTTIYLFAPAAIGIFLGTIARSMAQFALLVMMTIMPMMMLSGGMSPIESQPAIVQPFTWLLPSRHYMAFAQAVVFRSAGIDIIWPELATVAGLGFVFFAASLLLFRRSIATSQ